MWKAVRQMSGVKNPKPFDIYVKLDPPDTESAELAEVLFDLRDQNPGFAGYQIHWDTDSTPDEPYARDVSFNDWKMRNGLVILPDEIADHLPADVGAPETTNASKAD